MLKQSGLIPMILAMLLSACVTHSVNIKDYAGQRPLFSIKDFLQGKLHGYGVLTAAKNNRLVNHLDTTINTKWQGNDGLVKQVFEFSNGEKKTRLWCLHMIDEHHFSLISDAYDGTVAGLQYGNVIHMTYQVTLPANNYFDKLHTSGNWLQTINNSPEHALYTLVNSGNVISDLKAVKQLGQKTTAILSMPKNIDIGEYCRIKDNEWRAERAALLSSATFELDNWLFLVNKNVVIQQTAVKQHGNNLGELNIVLFK